MSITLFGAASNPSDNGTLFNTAPPAVVPPASMLSGDLVFAVPAVRSSSATLAVSNAGGQTWNALTLQTASGSINFQAYWCIFNGTWSANPSFVSSAGATVCISVILGVARPTVGSNTWAVDVAQTTNNFSAPVSPFDVTATGKTAIASSTITFFVWVSTDDNTWGLQTVGFSNVGAAQYRNVDTGSARDMSLSLAYKVLNAPGITGDVVNRQLTKGGDAGRWIAVTFREQSAGVTISSAGDALFHQNETGIVIAGTAFGATHTGAADIIVSPTNNIADGAAVVQTQTAWADTQVTMTASGLTSFAYATDLYLFVKSSTGASNSSGFVIRREAIVNMTGVLKNLAGATQNNLTNLQYRATLSTINGALVTSAGSNGTTDGSGNFAVPTFYSPDVLASDVWASVAFDGASLALSPATIVKLTPTYT